MDLKAKGEMVRQVSHLTKCGASDIQLLIDSLRILLEKKCWRKFTDHVEGKQHEHETWESFVTSAKPFDGLNVTVELIDNMVRDDKALVDLIDQAKQKKPGGRNNPHGNNQHQAKQVTVDNIHSDQRPSGTSADAALRRLRKERPDLHKQVINREKTPNTAMIEAGFRPKTATIRLDKIESIATTLKKKLSKSQIKKLKEIL